MSGLILAVLKDAEIRPEVREELYQSGEEWQNVAWDGLDKVEENQVKVAGWVVRRNYSVDIFGAERYEVSKSRVGDRGWWQG